MPFKSSLPDVSVPFGKTIWEWLFDSEHSSLDDQRYSHGFRDAETGLRISFAEARDISTWIATSLAEEYDVEAGDCVSIFCHNTIFYPMILLAAFRIGAVISGASPAYTVPEMTNALQKAASKVVFADQICYQNARNAMDTVGLSQKSIVIMDESHPGQVSIKDLITRGRSPRDNQVRKWSIPSGQSASDYCALLCFSSGTTGLPKAVKISHGNVIAQCCQMRVLLPHEPQKTLLSPLPLFHITGLVQIMLFPISINQEIILTREFKMEKMLDAIVKYKADELWLVPPILIRLINDPIVQKFDLSHVKQFNTGAAPLSPEVIHKLSKKFPNVGVKQGWGMTESTSCITSTPPRFLGYKYAHTVGAVVPNTILKFVDPENGQEVGINEPGEILAKGPQISMGYKDNAQATKDTYDEDGFLHTGDLGSIDEQGLVVIHDRIKELIKVRGIGVAPAELEGVLMGHPLIQDAAVIGIPDDYSGELPRAFVVLKESVSGSPETERHIKEFMKNTFTRPKWLDGGVVFLDIIPKSASGKVLRRVLKREHLNEVRKQSFGLPKSKL